MTSEDTALPCPYARLIVGTRHCRVLISGNINSDATGIDIIGNTKSGLETSFDKNRRLKLLLNKRIPPSLTQE